MIAARSLNSRGSRIQRSPLRLRGSRGSRRRQFQDTPESLNWEQYREVFEAIVSSNGWNDVTATLQLLSHLHEDALNVALLVPESRRVVPGFLIKSLSDHYSSPGRLAEYIQASVSAGV